MAEEEKEYWQKYFDNYISHAIGAVEYGNYFYEQIKDMADSAKADCDSILEKYVRCGTKKRCKEIELEIKECLEDLEDEIAAFIALELPKIIDNENEWLDTQIAPYLNIRFDKVLKAAVILGSIPIAAAGPANSFGKNVADKLFNIYNTKIIQGYITGSSLDDLNDDYEPRFNSFYRGLEADSETLGYSLGSQYDRIIFTKNDDKIQKYIWSALLDSSTCIFCGSMDGQTFDSVTSVPIYPPHDKCRCQLLIVPNNIEESMFRETYSEWLERQDKPIQRKVLGKTRFELYEKGVKFKSFVNNGTVTPVKDLKNNQK